MSNDARLWMVRIGIAGFILLDLYLLGKIRQVGISEGSSGWWFGLLLVSIIVSIPLFIAHSYFKARRWTTEENGQKIATETLSALGRQSRRRKKGSKE